MFLGLPWLSSRLDLSDPPLQPPRHFLTPQMCEIHSNVAEIIGVGRFPAKAEIAGLMSLAYQQHHFKYSAKVQ